MAQGSFPGSAAAGSGGVPQALVAAVTAALDRAFIDTVHARYGGAMSAMVVGDGAAQEQLLRASPANVTGRLLLELHLLDEDGGGAAPNPGGFSNLFQGLSRIIGHVTMQPAPGGRMMDVKVVTELFDDQDGAARVSETAHATGVLLQERPPHLAGGQDVARIDVVRSPADQQQRGLSQRQGQRGWLPHPERTRGNRGGGLGVNGRVTAPPSQLSLPVSATLLRRLAERLVQAKEIGDRLERVVVGLEHGDAG